MYGKSLRYLISPLTCVKGASKVESKLDHIWFLILCQGSTVQAKPWSIWHTFDGRQSLATSEYVPSGVFLKVQLNTAALPHYLQRYSWFCVFATILANLVTSSVTKFAQYKTDLNISGTREDIAKRKMSPFFIYK